MDIKSKEDSEKIISDLKGAKYNVGKVETKELKRTPPPPFTTSTLQQEANGRLGFSAKQTMRVAQQLYEGVDIGDEGLVGLITYMRTDSINLAVKFLNDSKTIISQNYGDKYALEKPRFYTNRSKNAQEAHEAVRPTEASRTPESMEKYLDKNQFRLYDLIWRRAMATQMANSIFNSSSADILSSNNYTFRANGRALVFDGFLKLYPDKVTENFLPPLIEDEPVDLKELKPEEHFTEPPARFSDASLVKILESYGIGRPSTYAPTISTIEDRGYVEKDENKKLKPKEIAFLVNDLLTEHFNNIVDFQFTAKMEDSLDAVARGEIKWQPLIANFYTPFKENLDKKDAELKKSDLTEEKTDEICDKCGKPMVIKMGRYGKFLACSGYPDCKNIKSLNPEETKIEQELVNEKCDKCGSQMIKKMGRFGPFIACSNYPTCKNIKNVQKKIGIACPQCGQGELVEKSSRRGKKFFSCSRYPDCKFALWNKPTGEKCESCGGLLTATPKGNVKCENKDCPTYVERKTTTSKKKKEE